MIRMLARLAATTFLALGLVSGAMAQTPANRLTALLNQALAAASAKPGFSSMTPEQKAAAVADAVGDMMPGLSDQILGIIEAAVGLSGASTGGLAQAILDLAAQTGNTGALTSAVAQAYNGLSNPDTSDQPLTGFQGQGPGGNDPDFDPTQSFTQQFEDLVKDVVNNVTFHRGGSGS